MSTIAAGTTSGTALVNTGDTTGTLVLQTNGTTTAVTIGTNQVVTLAQPLPVASGGTGSASGLNLATSATGTLPVANGGTGATSLTANNVILGNGTSAVQFVAPGTNGNVLTSNGTTWTSAAAGGNWTFLTSASMSGSSTDLNGFVSAAYDNYAIIFQQAGITSNQLYMRVMVGGSVASSALYNTSAIYTDSSGSNLLRTQVNETTGFRLSNGSTTGMFGVIYLQSGSGSYNPNAVYQVSGGTSTSVSWVGGGVYNSAAQISGVSFHSNGGASTAGTVRIYGIKNS